MTTSIPDGEDLPQRILVVLCSRWVPHAQRERNDDIRSELLHLFQFFRVAACRDDLAGTKVFRQLHGKSARGSGCAIDQDRFAGCKVSALRKRGPGRHAGICDGGGRDVIERVREFYVPRAAYRTELGKSSERRLRQGEIDPSPILRYPDSIGARD